MKSQLEPELKRADSSYEVEVLHSGGDRLRLRCPAVFKNKNNGYHHTLADLMTLKGICQIEVNPKGKSFTIKYDQEILDEDALLDKFAQVIVEERKDGKIDSTTIVSPFLTNPELFGKNGHKSRFSRVEDVVTSWDVKHTLPGRLRTRHFILEQRKELIEHLEKKLLNISEFDNFSVNKASNSVLLHFNHAKMSQSQALKILEETIVIIVEENRGLKKRGRVNQMAICSAGMALAVVAEVLFPPLAPIAIGFSALLAIPIFKDAWEAIRKKQIKVDILDATVIGLCVVSNQAFVAAFMIWVVNLAKGMLDHTSSESAKLLSQVFGKAPRFAWLYNEQGAEVQAPVEKLKAGDIIIAYPGEAIPVDGEVHSGDAMVDQQSLTGESTPVEKKEGDEVFAATMVVAGKLLIRVKETGANTKASKIVQIINQSAQHKTKLHSIGERMADKMVLPTFGLAGLGLITGGFGAVLAIFNSDYGTGIRIAAPMAVLSCVALAAKNGVLIKKSEVLEKITQIDTVLFDKTGTLTHEVPEVSNIIVVNHQFSSKDILIYAAAAEQKFTHPIAKAILEKAKEQKLILPKIEDSKCHIGFGIQVDLGGKEIKVGSARFMEREKIKLPEKVKEELQRLSRDGGTIICVAVDNHLAGIVELQNSHRPEALAVLEALRKRGVKELVLISGDNEAATKKIAEMLGMDRYFSQVLPEDKANYVRKLQKEGRKVMMVGDGINDSVALSYADVSVSLRGASDIATDVADVVMMDGGLSKLDFVFEVGIKMQKNIRRSLAMIVVPNTLAIVGAMFGMVNLVHTLVLNNGFNIMATVNGMLPFYEACEKEEQQKELIENTKKTLSLTKDGSFELSKC